MSEEKKKPNPPDMDAIRFYSLVTMFASSAYQAMGKLSNPLTGKVERNLDSAQGFIDILGMLEKKTKGNLAKEEEDLLSQTITDLRMNFIREKEKPQPAKKEEAAKEPPAEKVAAESPPASTGKEEKKEEKEKPEKASGPIITPPPDEGTDKKGE